MSSQTSGKGRRSTEANSRPSIERMLQRENESWDVDHVKVRILEEEERLHLQAVWQKVGRVWLFLGNLGLVALIVIVTTYRGAWTDRYIVYLYGLLAISALLSPVLVYRQYKRMRETRLLIKRLSVLRRRLLIEQDESSADAGGSPLANQKRYRDDALDVIAQFREEANRNRRIHNRFQAVIIAGSVGAAAITTASVSYVQARWAAVAVTAAVGLAAGFTGYYKYHERSFSSQQAADAIEREYEAVELRVGKYHHKSEEDAYAIFAETVDRLRDEHSKRQQQLDQPMELKREEQ